jgi:hypothetical protein
MANIKDNRAIVFGNKQIYKTDDSRYTIMGLEENDGYIAWDEMACIDKGWGPYQYAHVIMAYDKSKKVAKSVYSITDERCGTHYNVYLGELEGSICNITINPEEEGEMVKKKINLEEILGKN